MAAILVLCLWLLSACQPTKSPAGPTASGGVGRRISVLEGGSYTLLSVRDLASMLERKDFFLVNVHTPYEGQIHQTDALIRYDEIGQHLDQLPARDARIVLYCRSGSMSAEAAQALARLGYTQVHDIEGGMRAWEAAGYPLER